MRALDTPTAINELTILPKDWEERTIPFSKELAEILRQHPKVASCPLVFPSSKSHLNHRFLHARCKDICAQDLTQPSGISALPRHSGNTLAARGDRGQNRARVARPRVACDEGNGEPAPSDDLKAEERKTKKAHSTSRRSEPAHRGMSLQQAVTLSGSKRPRNHAA